MQGPSIEIRAFLDSGFGMCDIMFIEALTLFDFISRATCLPATDQELLATY